MTVEKQLKAIFNIPEDVQTTPVAMAIEFESLMKRLEIKQKYVKELYDKYIAQADIIESEHENRTISILTGISELGFSDKCTKALSRKGVLKLGDLREVTRAALMDDKCIGSDNVDRLDKIIAPLELRYKINEDFQEVGDDVIDDSNLENADKGLNRALNRSDKEVEEAVKERVAQEMEEFKETFKDSMCADCAYRLSASDCSKEECVKNEETVEENETETKEASADTAEYSDVFGPSSENNAEKAEDTSEPVKEDAPETAVEESVETSEPTKSEEKPAEEKRDLDYADAIYAVIDTYTPDKKEPERKETVTAEAEPEPETPAETEEPAETTVPETVNEEEKSADSSLEIVTEQELENSSEETAEPSEAENAAEAGDETAPAEETPVAATDVAEEAKPEEKPSDTPADPVEQAVEDAVFKQVEDFIDIEGGKNKETKFYGMQGKVDDNPDLPFFQGPIEDYYPDTEEGREQMRKDTEEREKALEPVRKFAKTKEKSSQSPLLKAMAKIRKEKKKEQAVKDRIDGVKTEDTESREIIEKDIKRLEKAHARRVELEGETYTGVNEEVDVSDDDFSEFSDSELF